MHGLGAPAAAPFGGARMSQHTEARRMPDTSTASSGAGHPHTPSAPVETARLPASSAAA